MTKPKRNYKEAKDLLFLNIKKHWKTALYNRAKAILKIKNRKGGQLGEYNSMLLYFQSWKYKGKYYPDVIWKYTIVKKQGDKFEEMKVNIF